MTTYYMACLDLTGRRTLVVGGGRIAFEKIQGLLASEAAVHVIATEVDDEVRRLADDGAIDITLRAFRSEDVAGAFLVIAATNDMDVNTAVFEAADARSIPVNVVDVPALCSFILPAVERNGTLAVTVSTAGASPALAKRIKREIADKVGEEYVTLARLLEAERPWAKETLATYEDRKVFFEDIVNGLPDPIELLRLGDLDAVRDSIERAKRGHARVSAVTGPE
jgi:siroheme synthase-like protein